jgi:hypothetical protein
MYDLYWPVIKKREAGMKVSPHFTFASLTRTDHRAFLDEQAAAPASVRINLVRLAVDILEPIVSLCGPIAINSAYRCPSLNKAIGGAAKSQHMDGLAADIVPTELDLVDAYKRILQSGVPFDQLILEFGRWIHVSSPYHAQDPRRQALMIWETGKYERFAANDPRVKGDLLV